MSRSRRRWLWLLGAGALAALGYALITSALGPRVPVAIASRCELVQRVVASGRVMPPARVRLGSTLTARVERVLVEEGQQVRAGQLLLQLADDGERAAVGQARAAVAQAEARLRQLKHVGSKVALEALRQTEVDLGLAESKRRRARALAERGAMTPAELEDATKAYELARSRQQSAAIQAASTGSAGTEYQFTIAALAQARAGQDAAEARLGLTRVLAPCDGLLLARSAEPGDIVQPGHVLMVLARAGRTQLVFQPEEKNLAFLRRGQRALASADAYPRERFEAVIASIAPAVDAQRGTIEVKLDVPRPPAYLRPDMTVSVDVEAARRPRALVLPAEAVREAASDHPFALVVSGGRTRRRPLKLGLTGAGEIEVVSGLAEGEAVVLPAARVGEDARVRVRVAPRQGR